MQVLIRRIRQVRELQNDMKEKDGKELVEKANTNLRKKETDTAILKRRAYFILDEFGNLPKMENIEGMVTVGRSRGIRYLFVLQSFSQLNAKYGKDIGDIIKTNCKEYVP